MDATTQVEVPDSFRNLYLLPGRSKPSIPWESLLERYELSESLANILMHRAGQMVLDLKICDTDILDRVHTGLIEAPATLNAAEARWVVIRLAELMGWELPLQRYPAVTAN